MVRKRLILVILFAFIFTLVGCVGDKKNEYTTDVINSSENIEKNNAVTTVTDKGSVAEQENRENVSDKEENKASDVSMNSTFLFPDEKTRPYAVMIDNEGTKCLPQGGLDKAQVIYEIIVEGGVTRLMPVFWGNSLDKVGPVRSSRHYFLDYSMEHDAIYVHFGWSPMAMVDISKLKINNINGVANGGEIFWDLTKDRRNWQDSYTSMEKIKEYVNKVKYRKNTDKNLVFPYNKTGSDLINGQKAEKISIKYSNSYTCGYVYDTNTKLYKRFRKDNPHIERFSEKQLEATNIVIQFVENFTIKGDKEGRQEVKTVGKGSGWYITSGKAVKIKWTKDSRKSQTQYTDEKGDTIKVNPGQTWVQIVPLSGKVEIK